MNKKNVFKIILDILMAIVLSLMFKKMALGLTFHEIGGLVLLAVMVFHVIINWKWVVAAIKNFSSKETPKKTKVCFIIDILLFVCFILIGVSGVFMSKVVFNFNVLQNIPWQIIHYTTAALALAFIGIHLGLHYSFITGMLKKILPGKGNPQKIIGIVLSIVIILFGAYSLKTTSYVNWITMPFTGQTANGHGGNRGNFNGEKPSGEFPGSNSSESTSSDSSSDSSESTSSDSSSNNTAPTPPSGKGFQGGKGNKNDFGQGKQDRSGNGFGQTASVSSALITVANFFSIMYLFAGITVLISHFTKPKKKPAVENTTEA